MHSEKVGAFRANRTEKVGAFRANKTKKRGFTAARAALICEYSPSPPLPDLNLIIDISYTDTRTYIIDGLKIH